MRFAGETFPLAAFAFALAAGLIGMKSSDSSDSSPVALFFFFAAALIAALLLGFAPLAVASSSANVD